jgi:hypothetical protein
MYSCCSASSSIMIVREAVDRVSRICVEVEVGGSCGQNSHFAHDDDDDDPPTRQLLKSDGADQAAAQRARSGDAALGTVQLHAARV